MTVVEGCFFAQKNTKNSIIFTITPVLFTFILNKK